MITSIGTGTLVGSLLVSCCESVGSHAGRIS